LWNDPQAILTMSVAPSTFLAARSTFIEKSPQGSPHVHTCALPEMHQQTAASSVRTGMLSAMTMTF
jgi:hypothetical protein